MSGVVKIYFNIDHDFYLNLKDDQRRDKKYTTSYTTLALEYDNNDIVEVLKTLTVEDYSETKIDTDDIHPPILYVFGKKIDEKLVYIKLKIRERNRRCIVCVSFHFAMRPIAFPYNKK